MSFHSWLKNLRSALVPVQGKRQNARRRSGLAGALRPCFEVLEDRLTLSFSWGGSYLADTYPGPVVTAEFEAVGDFTGDGIPDRVTSGSYTAVDLRPGNGDGTFAAPIRTEISPGACLEAADFNTDGRLDVVTVTSGGGASDFGGIGYVWLGRGDGTFTLADSFGVGLDIPLAIDTDGTSLAVAGIDYDGQSVVSVLYNNGDLPSIPRMLRIDDVNVMEGNAGTASATFTVAQPSGSTETVTVNYTTLNADATAGSDYQAASGTLTFAPGETSKTITVPVIGDRIGEPNETFAVSLSSPANATIGDGYGVGTIMDDEPRISISDVTKKEGKRNQTTQFTFTVTLSAAYDQAVTMSFRTLDGTAKASQGDYVAKTGTLTFAPGETTKTITIDVKGDSKKESNETFTLELFGASSNAMLLDAFGLGLILNDD